MSNQTITFLMKTSNILTLLSAPQLAILSSTESLFSFRILGENRTLFTVRLLLKSKVKK